MQAKTQITKRQKQFTGWHFLAIIVGFFVVIIGVNIYMASSALRAWTGLVVKNTYVASQEYNDKLAANRAQHALGWTSSVKLDEKIFTFTLVDGEGKSIKAEQVIVQINRPVGTKEDVELILQQNEDGLYSANVDLRPGTWKIYVVASFADQPDFEHYYKVNIKG